MLLLRHMFKKLKRPNLSSEKIVISPGISEIWPFFFHGLNRGLQDGPLSTVARVNAETSSLVIHSYELNKPSPQDIVCIAVQRCTWCFSRVGLGIICKISNLMLFAITQKSWDKPTFHISYLSFFPFGCLSFAC